MKKRFWVLPLPEIFSASDNRARVEGGAGGALAPPPPHFFKVKRKIIRAKVNKQVKKEIKEKNYNYN